MRTPKPPKKWGKSWVGLRVRALHDIKNKGGQVIKQGRPAVVHGTYSGLELRAVTRGKMVHINRVSPFDVRIVGKSKSISKLRAALYRKNLYPQPK